MIKLIDSLLFIVFISSSDLSWSKYAKKSDKILSSISLIFLEKIS